MDRKLKRGIVAVFIANMINVIFSLATNFLLPKFLSVNSYAAIKTFQLYVSYVGLLHFGYVDGMYLKYGGMDIGNHVDKGFSLNLSTMRMFQITLTLLLAFVGVLTRDWIIILFTVSVMPQNLSNYFKFLYQATGDFKRYGRIMNVSTISTFAINMILLLIFRTDSYLAYIVLYVLLYYAIWLVLEIQFRRSYTIEKSARFSWNELTTNIKDGFLLTLGNLASMMLTSVDRWFVKFLMDTIAFAKYSFAVSVENFLNLAITPITTTLYNFFCREARIEKHREILQCVIVFATILPAAAFPVKFILEHFLTEYLDASGVVFFLFSAQIFNIIIRSVFVNLYKVQRKQKTYFVKLVVVLTAGFIFNAVCYYFWQVKEAFALGTLLSGVLWFVISVGDFEYLEINIRNYLYIAIECITFLLCGFVLGSISGLFAYMIISAVALAAFMRPTMIMIIAEFRIALQKYIRKRN